MSFTSRLATLFIGLVGAVAATTAVAVDYPTRPVKWVVPYPPGGTTDVLARIVAQWLSDKMGQQFVIENKPGGGNNIGTEFVINAPPDGYTMLLVNPANGINATLYKNLPFNFVRDIAPVAGIVRAPNVMVVTNSLPAKSVAEFIAYCKANPGKINMASSGSGTSVHLSGELFKFMTGCDMLHVPFKGAGPALTDLIGGQVHVLFDNLPSSAGHIKGGRIRALAVTSAAREPSFPDLPTVAETVPGYEATAWFGIGMPKNTPREIIDKVNAEVNRALADAKFRERLAELGGKPIPGTPEDFGKVNMASSGSGTSVHLSGELFKMMTGIQMQHVPYKGSGPALIDLIGGQVDVLFDNMPSSIGHIKAGKLRALGVTTAKRSFALPDVPTVAETVPGYEASAWFGMAVPKGTPASIVQLLNREINAALADPGIKAKLAELGGEPLPGTPAAFWKLHAAETEKWAKVVKASGAKAE